MSASGTVHEWFRFLDVTSDDEAVCALRQMSHRLDSVYQDLEHACRALAYSPDDDVTDALRVSRSTLSEAIESIEAIAGRFRAGERHKV